MEHKTRKLTRRQSLGLAGMTGAGLLASRAIGVPGLGGDSPSKVRAAGSCSLAPNVTEGPFWEDEELKRSDITGGQDGVPLDLKMTILSLDDDCSPYQGAQVDIWHANAEGSYSDEPAGMGNADTLGETWLRGYQLSNANGVVRFTTIYPGWYSGRAVHIHVRIRTSDGSVNYTTQLFFDQDTTDAVTDTDPYEKGTTTNAQDSIYQQEVQAGNVLLVPLTGSIADGFSGTAEISLQNLPESGDSGDTSCDASLRSKEFRTTKHGKRALDLRIKANEKVKANARLRRGGKTVAHKRIDGLAAGRVHTLTVPIAGSVGAGAAGLELELTDRAGNSKTVKRSVHVPRG